ncbi:MAG: hypothetical protein AN484_24215 [Aphanizomenon flos-aquae WA102]|uniref:Uncharacterized protein n=1 Tax=Aphanizomenon flos-aquae WA102 TaxID=1710896 RepID=A0A1B7WMY8_APHFL|nr:MAG: hypothetical protein AN484_24215 [Aphanizomenon flos-aquae WA102]
MVLPVQTHPGEGVGDVFPCLGKPAGIGEDIPSIRVGKGMVGVFDECVIGPLLDCPCHAEGSRGGDDITSQEIRFQVGAK